MRRPGHRGRGRVLRQRRNLHPVRGVASLPSAAARARDPRSRGVVGLGGLPRGAAFAFPPPVPDEWSSVAQGVADALAGLAMPAFAGCALLKAPPLRHRREAAMFAISPIQRMAEAVAVAAAPDAHRGAASPREKRLEVDRLALALAAHAVTREEERHLAPHGRGARPHAARSARGDGARDGARGLSATTRALTLCEKRPPVDIEMRSKRSAWEERAMPRPARGARTGRVHSPRRA